MERNPRLVELGERLREQSEKWSNRKACQVSTIYPKLCRCGSRAVPNCRRCKETAGATLAVAGNSPRTSCIHKRHVEANRDEIQFYLERLRTSGKKESGSWDLALSCTGTILPGTEQLFAITWNRRILVSRTWSTSAASRGPLVVSSSISVSPPYLCFQRCPVFQESQMFRLRLQAYRTLICRQTTNQSR